MNRLAIAALVAAVACTPSPEPWGSLPTDPGSARALVERSTRREVGARPADVDVRGAIDSGKIACGFDAIDAALANATSGKSSIAFLLGTRHDSVAHIEAFRRLVGPRSRTAWTHVLVEQLRATGRWANVDSATQRGDDDALARSDYGAIAASQEKDDYTAWKFGGVDAIVELVAMTKGSGRTMVGCDMSTALQTRLGAAREPFGLRLRELHCSFALRDALAKTPDAKRVAALWGSAHVDPDGFPRFLTPALTVVAWRVTEPPPDVVLVDPILAGDRALVLATPDAAKHFERKRTTGAPRKPLPPGVKLDADRRILYATIGKQLLVAAIDSASIEVELAEDAPEVTVTTFVK